MWWRPKSGNDGKEAPAELRERLAALETDFRALRRDVDDLDEQFRSFRGRTVKREALARTEVAPDAVEPVRQASGGNGVTSVHQLRAAGKWPFT